MKTDIKSLDLNELTRKFEELSMPAYKAKQVYRWLHTKNVNDFFSMTDISNKNAAELEENFYITSLNMHKRLVSNIDNTVKYLYMLPDSNCIESVLMEYKHGYSVCVSTQVGCKMGCGFCASAPLGFVRNLEVSEMLEQVYMANRDCNGKLTHIVLMGIGEPLDNFENTVKFINMVSDKNGLNISQRHISLSTCGLVDKIYKLASLRLQITLSVSLHAPNDRIRNQSMPVNRKWNVETLIQACKHYSEVTGRRVSYEYAVIDGKNDSPSHARELAALLKGTLCHVNLIPVNTVSDSGYIPADRIKIKRFAETLSMYGINATVRRTLGADINAACGQLRRETISKDRSDASR